MSRWLSHWGLSQAPFSKEISDADPWVPAARAAAIERLVQSCHERGHAVLAGEPGVGKTCVLRALRHRLPEAGFRLTYAGSA
jgi:type II secretory pathway predicted ATPase ExeA